MVVCGNSTLDVIGKIGFEKQFHSQLEQKSAYVQMSETVLNEIMLRTVQPPVLWGLPLGRKKTYNEALKMAHELVDDVTAGSGSGAGAGSAEQHMVQTAQGPPPLKNMLQTLKAAVDSVTGNALSHDEIFYEVR